MDWRTGNRLPSDNLTSRGGSSRGTGRGQGRGRGRGRGKGKGVSALHRGPSTQISNSFQEEQGQIQDVVADLDAQLSEVADSSKAQQPQKSGIPVTPYRKRRDILPSRERKPSDAMSITSGRFSNHVTSTSHTPPSGVRPKNNHRRANRLPQRSVKELSPKGDNPLKSSSQASDLRTNIDTFVEHVRAMAVANSSPNKSRNDGRQTHDTHFDWAEDDGDILSDLEDDWSISRPTNGLIKENPPVEQHQSNSSGTADNKSVPDAGQINDSLDRISETARDSTAEDLLVGGIQSFTSEDAPTEPPIQQLELLPCENDTIEGFPTSSSDNSEPNFLPSAGLEQQFLALRTEDEDLKATGAITDPKETSGASSFSAEVVKTTPIAQKRGSPPTVGLMTEPQAETYDKSPNQTRGRNNVLRNHFHLSSPTGRAEQDSLQSRSGVCSPEGNHRRSRFYDSSHPRTNSTRRVLPSRVHATRPIITPDALSIISKTLGVKDAPSSRT